MAVFTDFFSEDVLDFVGGANIIKDSRQSLQLECDANIRENSSQSLRSEGPPQKNIGCTCKSEWK